jgi:hypothetical protein
VLAPVVDVQVLQQPLQHVRMVVERGNPGGLHQRAARAHGPHALEVHQRPLLRPHPHLGKSSHGARRSRNFTRTALLCSATWSAHSAAHFTECTGPRTLLRDLVRALCYALCYAL